jgi:hypothetical protein
MSQQELGDAVDAHWITISKLERGKMKLTVAWLERLADALRVEPADLLPSTKVIGRPRHLGVVADDGTVTILPKAQQVEGVVLSSMFNYQDSSLVNISGSAYEPVLRAGDLVQLLPMYEDDYENRLEEGRLCLFEAKKRVGRFGFAYRASKPGTYDLFWLDGKRIFKGVKPLNIWLVATIIFVFNHP